MKNTDSSPEVINEDWLAQSMILNEELVTVIETAFLTLAKGRVTIPPIQQIPVSAVNGQVCVKSAYAADYPFFAIKMAGYFPNNLPLNIKGNQGCMCLFDSTTGCLETLIADNGLLTQLRTAASGAVAAKYLAPDRVNKVSVIGAGTQAKLQLQALDLVREFDSVSVCSRTLEKSQELACWIEKGLSKKVEIADSIKVCVNDSDVIITTTNATNYLLEPSYISKTKPVHITAMGADAPGKNELSPDFYSLADRYVCDLVSQSKILGELRSVIEIGVSNFDSVEELGNLCLLQEGRREKDRVTICDLTGVGILDLAIALYAREQFDLYKGYRA